jgi:hypothetical protein
MAKTPVTRRKIIKKNPAKALYMRSLRTPWREAAIVLGGEPFYEGPHVDSTSRESRSTAGAGVPRCGLYSSRERLR